MKAKLMLAVLAGGSDGANGYCRSRYDDGADNTYVVTTFIGRAGGETVTSSSSAKVLASVSNQCGGSRRARTKFLPLFRTYHTEHTDRKTSPAYVPLRGDRRSTT